MMKEWVNAIFNRGLQKNHAVARITRKAVLARPLRIIIKAALTLLPRIIIKAVLTLSLPLRKRLFSGREHYCPLCQNELSLFLPFPCPRSNAWCPVCGSLERHRLAWLTLEQKTNLFDSSPKSLLHISPERAVEDRVKNLGYINYLSADLYNPRAMVKMDITSIQCPDNAFDIIFCSHVLEHIPDDRRAMCELHRVLKPEGFALLMVPITVEKTFEDPLIMSPAERERLFGGADHVRRYGPDFKDRLEESGFNVRVFTAAEVVGENNIFRFGVRNEIDAVYICKKSSV
jgi:SAM-dependent methyltransferase